MLTEAEAEALRRAYNAHDKLIRLPPAKAEEATQFIKDLSREEQQRRQYWANRFHPLVLINGEPKIGEGTKIGIFSEVYDKAGIVQIGAGCDIGSFVAINCADSHGKTIGAMERIHTAPIRIGDRCFIGSHSFIGSGCIVGDCVVVAAGTIIRGNRRIPDYSLVWGNPARVKKGYYRGKA